MSDRETALFANAAFYAAFAARDLKAMDEIWSRDRPVCCIHPGWPLVLGRAEVLASWGGILRNPNAPKIKCKSDRVEVYGDIAVVTCIEIINDRETLAATNIFVKATGRWALVHHQAGPANVDPKTLEDDGSEKPRKAMN